MIKGSKFSCNTCDIQSSGRVVENSEEKSRVEKKREKQRREEKSKVG